MLHIKAYFTMKKKTSLKTPGLNYLYVVHISSTKDPSVTLISKTGQVLNKLRMKTIDDRKFRKVFDKRLNLSSVNSFILMGTNFHGLRETCIFVDI